MQFPFSPIIIILSLSLPHSIYPLSLTSATSPPSLSFLLPFYHYHSLLSSSPPPSPSAFARGTPTLGPGQGRVQQEPLHAVVHQVGHKTEAHQAVPDGPHAVQVVLGTAWLRLGLQRGGLAVAEVVAVAVALPADARRVALHLS